jgi:hypothetical protein
MTMSNLKHKPGAGRASRGETPGRPIPGHVAGIVAILLAGWLGAALATALPQAPPQTDPATLPARDVHQGLLIAADPYTDEARSKAKFGKKNPVDSGILALDVYLRNDTDQPIQVNLDRIRLMLAVPGNERQRIEPLSTGEAAERIVNKKGPDVSMSRTPFPGTGSVKGSSKDVRKMEEIIKPLALSGGVVSPHGTVHGFLFFDLAHHFNWVQHATLYVPELHFVPSRKELLYFEVELSRASPR